MSNFKISFYRFGDREFFLIRPYNCNASSILFVAETTSFYNTNNFGGWCFQKNKKIQINFVSQFGLAFNLVTLTS